MTDIFFDYYDSGTGQVEPNDNDHFVYSGNNAKPDWDYYKIYDQTQSAYVDYARVHYYYNSSNGLFDHGQVDVWDATSSSWNPMMNIIRTYSGNDITSEVEQSWDDTNNTWKNTERETYTYSTSGNQKTIEMISQQWDDTNNAWQNSYKNITVIDITNNNILSKETYSWNNGNWEGQSKITYTYTNAGSELNMEEINWDSANGSWSSGGIRSTKYFYGTSIAAEYLLIPQNYNDPYEFYDSLDDNGQDWNDVMNYPFFYALDSIEHYTRTILLCLGITYQRIDTIMTILCTQKIITSSHTNYTPTPQAAPYESMLPKMNLNSNALT